jgi:hypothetical protein
MIKEAGEPRGQDGVTAARRAHSNDPALDQLVPMIVVWNPCELLDGDQSLA